jgi:aspartate-semialdehyde dehydrogenase
LKISGSNTNEIDEKHMDKEFNVAVCGATGNVGRKMLEVLEERDFPIKNIKFLASERSVGQTI